MEDTIGQHGFMGLVTSFYVACWQQLGKMANPFTNKIERNLDQAKYSIDMLLMLREKTKGNLTKDEEKALTQVISNLQMNYVDELNKPAPAADQEKSPLTHPSPPRGEDKDEG